MRRDSQLSSISYGKKGNTLMPYLEAIFGYLSVSIFTTLTFPFISSAIPCRHDQSHYRMPQEPGKCKVWSKAKFSRHVVCLQQAADAGALAVQGRQV